MQGHTTRPSLCAMYSTPTLLLVSHYCSHRSLLLTSLPGAFAFLKPRISPAKTMPVHRDREKKESVAEEMDVEDQEQEASTSEEEDSDSSSVSEEDGDSSGERALLVLCVIIIIIVLGLGNLSELYEN